MERDWLEARLAEGRSIESIAKEVAKHPSTVGYWAKKHGLVSPHAERHAAKGGISREVLAHLVAAQRSSHEIGRELGVSQTTVRHWLKQHGLATHRAPARGARKCNSQCRRHDHRRVRSPRHDPVRAS